MVDGGEVGASISSSRCFRVVGGVELALSFLACLARCDATRT